MAQSNRKVGGQTGPRVPAFIWALLAVLVGAIAWRGLTERPGSGHPEPRAEITGQFVVSAERYADNTYVQETYKFARSIPNVLDGLHCYCECATNFGHRSLLTCFESDHGADCGICLQEANIAYQMTQRGATLDQIRAQIDAQITG